ATGICRTRRRCSDRSPTWATRLPVPRTGAPTPGPLRACPDLDRLQESDEALLLLIGRRVAAHFGQSLLLLRSVLRDLLVRVGQHLLVVGADRADVGAAAAAGDHARAAQDALPEVEAGLGAQQLLARPGVLRLDDPIQ